MAYYAGHIRFHTVHHYARGDPGLFSFVKRLVKQPVVQNLIKQGAAAGLQAFGVPMPVTELAMGALIPAAQPPEQAQAPEQSNIGGGMAQTPQPLAMAPPHSYLPTSLRSEVQLEAEEGEEEEEEEEDEG